MSSPAPASSGFSLQDLEELRPSFPPPSSFLSCYGGLGRSGLSKNLRLVLLSSVWNPPRRFTPPSDLLCLPVAACLMLRLSETLTENEVIELLREHRGRGAIQTVKVRTGWSACQTRRQQPGEG